MSGFLAWVRSLGGPPKPKPVLVTPPPPAPPPTPKPALVSGALLRRLGWTLPDAYAPVLSAACRAYGIDTPARLAAFLGQVGHESACGQYRREIASGRAYEGRADLGNTQPGDGERFRGRGLIQITGRANTTAARDALRPGMDLAAFCGWLETVEGAATSAAWWWREHGCNTLADDATPAGFLAVSYRINGRRPLGVMPNGWKDRVERWEAAKAALAGKTGAVAEALG